ncbi:family 4 carbohydrate esterase [Favolaschia claudopus]|uniref:Family 4 carbohydrate esterase n=1 Tax=Favolaschia claudopus TaxID=2862362 RepID=A0AAW0DIM9_9AGAR
MLPQTLLALMAPLLVLAADGGDGGLTGATTSQAAAGYSCDPAKCKLPKCNCASTSPPGGLKPSEVPMFIVFTADDAVQSYTLDSVNQFLAQRKNPNGCPPRMTYYTSLTNTNYSLVTDWFVAGNEIADHTMTHVGDPPADEINGNLVALNALAGIPIDSIRGFRAPFLNYSVNMLKHLVDVGFTYDSSATSSIPVTDPGTDAYWPYTLDNGMANDCLEVEKSCKGEPKLPGFWEIPMYAFFDKQGVAGPHLMDPWLDFPNGESKIDDAATLAYMQDTFTAHYNGNRQPIGLYTHPIHLSTTYPGVNPPQSTIDMINQFLDWAQMQENVWIVSSEQLLEWVKNPVPVSKLDSAVALKCSVPKIDAGLQVCNGVPQNEASVLQTCSFPDFTFYTCYGCPEQVPTPANPFTKQVVKDGQQARNPVPKNCTVAQFDPIGNKCLCTGDCTVDKTLLIGPNGANLTGGGTGKPNASSTANPYQPFNGKGFAVPPGVWPATIVAVVGAFVGTMGVFGWF